MGLFRCSMSAVAILGAALLPKLVLSQVIPCAPSTNPDFTYEVIPEDNFEIRWSVDTSAETISFEVVHMGVAWTSVGFSEAGDMIGSDAVIGLPDDDNVVEYDLIDKDVNFVTPTEEQEITGTGVSQDGTSTTVTFTRPLTPSSEKLAISPTPGDETWLIWAFGEDNTLGAHAPAPNRGNLLLDLFCSDLVTVTVTPAPTLTNATLAPDDATTPAPGDTLPPTESPIGQEGVTSAPSVVGSGGTTMTAAPTPADSGVGGGDNVAPTVVDESTAPAEAGSPTENREQTGAAVRGGSDGGGGVWLTVAATGLVAVLGGATLVSW